MWEGRKGGERSEREREIVCVGGRTYGKKKGSQGLMETLASCVNYKYHSKAQNKIMPMGWSQQLSRKKENVLCFISI